jgi:LysM repeat protein
MKNWIVFAFIILTNNIFSQIENTQTEVIGGKKYYVHIVQSGNTLWGIHQLYNVSVEEIIKGNPGVENGLNEGQKIIILVPKKTIQHEVQVNETLFGISKKYDVTIENIILANPGAENGVKLGQKLKIPGVEDLNNSDSQQNDVPIETEPNPQINDNSAVRENSIKVSFTDSVIDHIVLEFETLYSISKRFMVPVEELMRFNNLKSSKIKPGEILKIPIKKEKVEQVKIREVAPAVIRKLDSTLLFPKREKYKIAIILPFYLDKGEGNSDFISTLATEFYMGAKLAIDSLEELGLKADVYVFDSKMDSISVKNILAKPEFKGMDLVFGPLFPENVDIVSRWCKLNNARMVCPAAANTSVLKNNPFVYSAVPSDATLMKGLAAFTLKNNSRDQIILIKSSNEKDFVLYETFRNSFLTEPFNGNRPKLIEASLENFTSFMKKGVKVILVFPTNEKLPALKFTNSLKSADQRFDSENIFVYGTKEWSNFDDVKPHFKNKYHFHFSSPNDLNYKYLQTEDLHRKYRSTYNSDMTKMAVQGFDVLYYFISDLLLSKKSENQIMNSFEMIQLGAGNGYENSHTFIIKQENFELINVEDN